MHDHDHDGLSAAFWLALLFTAIECIGGWWADSLALLADAGHMATDVAALGIAVVARRIASRPAHAGMSYGYGRARVLAAQINAVTLLLLGAWIVHEAIGRLAHPPAVQGGVVLVIAVAGLLANLLMMRWLHHDHDINSRAAFWHVLGDALGSLAAIIAGAVILLTGWMAIDPLLSLLIAAILFWGGWRLLRETTNALMEGTPPGIDPATIRKVMETIDGIHGIHHLHLWQLPDGQIALSAHVEILSMEAWPEQLLPTLLSLLREQGVTHATLQPERHLRGGDCPAP